LKESVIRVAFNIINKTASVLLLSGSLVVLAGCHSPAAPKENIKMAETVVSTLDLNTMKEKQVSYTKKEEILPPHSINNIEYNLQEYFNENTKSYQYVLSLRTQPLTELDKEYKIVPYKVIKLSVAATPLKEANLFEKVATSPTFVDSLNPNLEGNSFYLFSSSKPISKKDFRIETFFVNLEPTEDSKPGEKTYRYIYDTSGKGVSYE
jgi:hypothetical protein